MLYGIENSYLHKNLQTDLVFIEALLIIAKIWKQPICPSLGEYINKIMVYPGNGILCSIVKELSSDEKTWKKLKCTVSKRKSEKVAYSVIPMI